MHELSLCRSLLRIIEKKMVELNKPAQRVTAVWLEISTLCGVDVKMLQFYFTFVAENTIAENACLHIAIMPMPAKCKVCSEDVSMESFSPCPSCGNYSLVIAAKPELLVKSVEVR